MTATLGIDLAAQPAKTALCAIEWRDGRGVVRVLCRGRHDDSALDDDFLVRAMQGAQLDVGGAAIEKAAIDAPFGWPEPFVDAIVAHHRGEPWPSAIVDAPSRFTRRATDRFVVEHAKKVPLSVSADRIAVPAMRCAGLLAAISEAHGPEAVDRAGGGMVCEAYPDPALRHWTSNHSGQLKHRESYKGGLLGERRRELVAILRERGQLDDPEGVLALCAGEDDYLDALVCALVARATALGLTRLPEDAEDQRLARVEGWIHLPAGDLAALRGT